MFFNISLKLYHFSSNISARIWNFLVVNFDINVSLIKFNSLKQYILSNALIFNNGKKYHDTMWLSAVMSFFNDYVFHSLYTCNCRQTVLHNIPLLSCSLQTINLYFIPTYFYILYSE